MSTRKATVALPDSVGVSIARLEVKVDSIESTLQSFIRTATSPDLGFAASATVVMLNSETVKSVGAVERRVDTINKDHNERLVKLEGLSSRVFMGGFFTMGAVILDIVLHVTGVRP